MDLQEVGCGYMDWTGLAKDRDKWRMLVFAVMNLRAQWNEWNFLTSCKPGSFRKRTLRHGESKWLIYTPSLWKFTNSNFYSNRFYLCVLRVYRQLWHESLRYTASTDCVSKEKQILLSGTNCVYSKTTCLVATSHFPANFACSKVHDQKLSNFWAKFNN